MSTESSVSVSYYIYYRVRATAEAQEGLSAFLEKRPASWTIPPRASAPRKKRR